MSDLASLVQPPSKAERFEAAHLFRSRLIELAARAEAVAVGIIVANGKTLPPLGGQKLETARELLKLSSGCQRYALLVEIQIYADLRSAICHATITQPGGVHYCFRPAVANGIMRWRPVLLSIQEMDTILRDATAIVQRLERCNF